MYGFWNLLAGYVIVEARGLGMERLLNRATAADIRMEQVERRSYTVLRMRVSLPGYLRLKKLGGGAVPPAGIAGRRHDPGLSLYPEAMVAGGGLCSRHSGHGNIVLLLLEHPH